MEDLFSVHGWAINSINIPVQQWSTIISLWTYNNNFVTINTSMWLTMFTFVFHSFLSEFVKMMMSKWEQKAQRTPEQILLKFLFEKGSQTCLETCLYYSTSTWAKGISLIPCILQDHFQQNSIWYVIILLSLYLRRKLKCNEDRIQCLAGESIPCFSTKQDRPPLNLLVW